MYLGHFKFIAFAQNILVCVGYLLADLILSAPMAYVYPLQERLNSKQKFWLNGYACNNCQIVLTR
jgi:hypothetical protein